MEKELKPCPGCGGNDIEFEGIESYKAEGYYHCMGSECGWDSPLGLIADGEAEQLWNTRADTQISDTQVEDTQISDTKASAIPTSLIWLLENIREEERTRIYSKMKESLYDLIYVVGDDK